MFNFTTVVFDGTSPTFYFTNTSGWNTSSLEGVLFTILEIDLQILGVRRWRVLVIDTGKWKGIVRQAKARSGL